MIKKSIFRLYVISLILGLLGACGGQNTSNPSVKVDLDAVTNAPSSASQIAISSQSTNQPSEVLLSSKVLINTQNTQISGGEVVINNSIGVYVPRTIASVYKGKLADTGVTTNYCLGAGSDKFISCHSAAATALNPDQDGMVGRDVITPTNVDGKLGFSYSSVSKQAGGDYDKTECVKDNLTGLIWEGKPETGFRANTNSYTNFDSTTKLQKYVGNNVGYIYVAPTQAEVDVSNNTVGYKNAVNASALCGFNDWRLPTAEELHGLVDFSASPLTAIDNDWFPNALRTPYWSATASAGYAKYAWFVQFWDGQLTFNDAEPLHNDRHYLNSVRLVRGSNIAVTNRYSYANAGAEALDSQTNLIWRRCVEGMIWSGATCTGTASSYTQEGAMIQAKSQTGWRLPNVKELSSIIDRATLLPAVDAFVFPATPLYDFWSVTPFIASDVSFEGYAWYVNFSYGYANWAFRTYNLPGVRLVKDGS